MGAQKDLDKVKSDLAAVKTDIDAGKGADAQTKLQGLKTRIEAIGQAFNKKKMEIDRGFKELGKGVNEALTELKKVPPDSSRARDKLHEATSNLAHLEAAAKKT